MLPAQQQNSSFSPTVPGLQLAIDSTSLGAFKTCPRLYYYSIIMGWQPKETSVHLTFGILVHSVFEQYDHARAAGLSHREAQRVALLWALRETWDFEMKRPKLWGSEEKNRLSLIRVLIWGTERFAEEGDPLETVLLANGKPAVELSFSFNSGYQTLDGEPYLLCGHLDKLVRIRPSGIVRVVDHKTSRYQLSKNWFANFTPGNQFTIYTLAGQVVWKEPVDGLIVNGIQVGKTFARFARGEVPRPREVIEEWHRGLGRWLRQLEGYAREGAEREADEQHPSVVEAWPMNDTSCDKWGGCDFRDVCSRRPGSRQQWLEANFRQRIWDPLQRRGDV